MIKVPDRKTALHYTGNLAPHPSLLMQHSIVESVSLFSRQELVAESGLDAVAEINPADLGFRLEFQEGIDQIIVLGR